MKREKDGTGRTGEKQCGTTVGTSQSHFIEREA